MGESGEDVEMQQKVERWVSLSARGLAGENKLLNLFFFSRGKIGSFALFCSPADNTGGELGLDASRSVLTGPGSSGTPSPAPRN